MEKEAKEAPAKDYVLGLDIGTNSVGWAMIGLENGKPVALVDLGVRIFEAGLVDLKVDGKGKGPAADRRTARLHRRMLDRKARRLSVLFGRLQKVGLMPRPESGSSAHDQLPARPKEHPLGPMKARERREVRERMAEERDKLIGELDERLSKKWKQKLNLPAKEGAIRQYLPYLLRARAVAEKLEPFEIGRALYQLAHHRGFKSNRKAALNEEKERAEAKKKARTPSAFEDGQKNLEAKVQEHGTLGKYLLSLGQEMKRLREQPTKRDQYETEFAMIWDAQKSHYPQLLTDDLRRRIHWSIFHQRPLKNPKRFIGFCEFEKDKHGNPRRRAPMALLDAQRFRLLQKVNDLRAKGPAGPARDLTPQERCKLASALEDPKVLDKKGRMSFAKVRTALGLKKHVFNLANGGEEYLPGNSTAARLAEVFGAERWRNMPREEQDQVVEDWLSIHKDEALARRGEDPKGPWKLDKDAARRFGSLSLEDGYCSLSRQALAMLLPHMEAGCQYYDALVKANYTGKAQDATGASLPVVADALPGLRNPMVSRALAETRKVINSLIDAYGKPAQIRVELARELKKSAKDRARIFKENRNSQQERDAVGDGSLKDPAGVSIPPGLADKPWNIEKVRLAIECKWRCVYTRTSFSMSELFDGSVEVEHIIPRSRCLDDSWPNKTLCRVEENRNKGNRTPHEAYHDKPEWEAILTEAKAAFGENSEKFRRFKFDDDELKESLEGFTARQLNDTAYAAQLATKLLGRLYGDEAAKRVKTTSGGVTRYLREVWKLNKVLGDGPGKKREDHRHHAVDAVCVALTDEATVRMVNDAAASAKPNERFNDAKVEKPWPSLNADVQKAINGVIVSHRVSRKVNGPLHKETIHPKGSDKGSLIKIREGHPRHERLAESGSNHHVEIFECLDKNGKPEWKGDVVNTFEAMRRLKVNRHAKKCVEPIVKGNHGDGRFVFSLACGDLVELKGDDGKTSIYVVKSVDNAKDGISIKYVHVNDARPRKTIKVEGKKKELDFRKVASLKSLRGRCQKIVVTPLGEIRRAND